MGPCGRGGCIPVCIHTCGTYSYMSVPPQLASPRGWMGMRCRYCAQKGGRDWLWNPNPVFSGCLTIMVGPMGDLSARVTATQGWTAPDAYTDAGALLQTDFRTPRRRMIQLEEQITGSCCRTGRLGLRGRQNTQGRLATCTLALCSGFM